PGIFSLEDDAGDARRHRRGGIAGYADRAPRGPGRPEGTGGAARIGGLAPHHGPGDRGRRRSDADMSGIPRETYEFTRQIPFSEHLGIKVDSLEKGVARLSMSIRPE